VVVLIGTEILLASGTTMNLLPFSKEYINQIFKLWQIKKKGRERERENMEAYQTVGREELRDLSASTDGWELLPPEVEALVLSYLPPIHLLRLGCVSSSWQSVRTSSHSSNQTKPTREDDAPPCARFGFASLLSSV